MNHVLDRIPSWIGGDLDPDASREVQAHLETCASCRAAASDLREALDLVGADFEPGEADLEALHAAVMDQVRHAPPRAPFPRFLPLLGMAAATLLAVGLLRRHPPSPLPQAAVPVAALPPLPPPPELPKPPVRTPHRSTYLLRTPKRSDPSIARIEFLSTDPPLRIIWLATTPD
jgi:hypothetical protein